MLSSCFLPSEENAMLLLPYNCTTRMNQQPRPSEQTQGRVKKLTLKITCQNETATL